MSLTSHTRLLLVVFAFSCHEKTAVGPTIELTLDDVVRTVVVDRAMPLSSLVSAPPAQWIFIRADARDGRWLEIPTPATTYPDGELRLSTERGRVTLGVFNGAHALAGLSSITKIRVLTREAPTTLTIVTSGRERLWKGDTREVPLRDVLDTDEVRNVRIIGDTEIALTSITNAVLKTNKRGEHVVRVWDNGREHPTQEVRGVTKIVVE
ncbi:MAG: hypothetical protein M4D80_33705 [Myxococcota bacterium]|nr:hypothetical protein [Myxococcota bacterium]